MPHEGSRITIDVLYSEVCEHVADAEREIARAIHRAGVPDAHVRLHAVRSREEAEERDFRGSPTVRVNGRDVGGGAAPPSPGLDACRIYESEGGLVLPYPPWMLVLHAIEASGVEAGGVPGERQRENI